MLGIYPCTLILNESLNEKNHIHLCNYNFDR